MGEFDLLSGGKGSEGSSGSVSPDGPFDFGFKGSMKGQGVASLPPDFSESNATMLDDVDNVVVGTNQNQPPAAQATSSHGRVRKLTAKAAESYSQESSATMAPPTRSSGRSAGPAHSSSSSYRLLIVGGL